MGGPVAFSGGWGDGMGGAGAFCCPVGVLGVMVYSVVDPAAFGGHEGAEGVAEAAVGDLVVFDEQVGEDGLVELSADGVAGLVVEVGEVGEEVEALVDVGFTAGEVVDGFVELGLDCGAFDLDVAESLVDFGVGQCGVGGQVKQIFFFGGQGGEVFGEFLVLDA